MKHLGFLFCFIFTTVLAVNVNESCECGILGSNRRIVGGVRAAPHSYPWLVALMKGQRMHCGGALITDMHVLTAGHCITFGVHYSSLAAHIGMHDRLDQNHQVVRIRNGLIHPNFRSNAVRDINDIAMLTLSRRVKFSDVVRPICLPESGTEEDWIGLTMTVAGWGKTRQSALTSSRYLLETRVRLVDGATCQRNSIYRDNLEPNTMMCAYNLGKDACQGDSGGPMFGKLPNSNKRKYYQIGIVSWGIDCAKPDYPGVYTNVRKYKEWIKQETADGMYCR